MVTLGAFSFAGDMKEDHHREINVGVYNLRAHLQQNLFLWNSDGRDISSQPLSSWEQNSLLPGPH